MRGATEAADDPLSEDEELKENEEMKEEEAKGDGQG
eukprot:CAMPEP_0185593594 /NCGR_PEP_ID=MMETSP0434-20130131/71973_1 /TAXON_ID=626734 ORGANISM="Favella taraikaensis, Strain Fe Narragansett Bay" /NCGR_SAMPLE_ID=MMETSP0434 /ASSEMBLY_ACC=CAM_ASM_000379 /LENGTH=35 /DNA_ID= /DNA_START= /DNA_END= /DNA_ORIENTATION=